jgi:uncharacterized protein (TIGR00290 family)
MENYVAFFSGGKDGIYATYLAQKQKINVKHLLVLKTSIGISPHYENIEALEKIAKNMKKELIIFDMNSNHKLDEFIKDINISGIVSGDIALEDHLKWLENIAKNINVKLIEPLWKRNSLELVREMIKEKFVYSIIAVDKKKLSKKWLGYTFKNEEDIEKFVSANQSIDPAGEGGEFHTVVLSSPLFYREVVINAQRECESDRYHYLKFDVEMVK